MSEIPSWLKPYGVLHFAQKLLEQTTMKNVSSKKGWMTGMTHPPIEPPLIPIIQETNDGKSDKDSL